MLNENFICGSGDVYKQNDGFSCEVERSCVVLQKSLEYS